MDNNINDAILQLTRRSEQQDTDVLASTFVNVGNLLSILSNKDHQIIFGRRGTGKTHALKYFNIFKNNSNDISIYVDLRTIGSNTSLYNDTKRSIIDRSTILIKDVFQLLINKLMDIIYEKDVLSEKHLII